MLRLGKQGRITDSVDRVAAVAGAVALEARRQLCPGLGVQGAFRDEAQVALFLVLINVAHADFEQRPVRVGRFQPVASPPHGVDLPAGSGEQILGISGDRVFTRRRVHGYKRCSLRFHCKRIALLGNAERGVLRHIPLG